ncbi:Alcohol dehydrogenase N-terminal [Arabidopsis thaliana x Arabidopsis arenosa]|uniref:alcohol dehydrogenase n=1 Tax=Arabidopsis thaliana x Arabidopsis arenosa TaxID=1240361 RepID=A0A8T2C402_9BRAS|nr:Alcohol dehydrogenase N-terminal [Arabidopsis thaliana x Arabidopsis arenosa]
MDKASISSTEGKPIRCKAAILRKAGEPLVIEEIQVDPPQAYEVRIKILCTSLCHTDVTFWKLESGPLARFPRILGHEAVGVVESIGENVDGIKQGDVVLPVFHPQCEECKECKSPKSNWCTRCTNDFLSNTRRYGMTSRFKDSFGEDIHHFIFVSSFTEYTVVDIAHLVKISPEIPVDVAALLSCGVATGIGAAWKVADVEEGSTVAIFGLGAVGLAALPVSLGSYDLLRGRTICGTLFGGLKPKLDIPILVDRYLKKELNLDGLITHELSFEEINKAFDLLAEGNSIRCVVWMDK